MPAKVFISCGQASRKEQSMADQIDDWFRSQGYSTYVATQVQTLQELNSQIIEALKSSDYFLFINLPREAIPPKTNGRLYRGSVYSNQELAVAHAFGFEHMILLNHKHVKNEGVFRYLVVNTPEFELLSDVLSIVQEAVKSSRWENTFSRHLQLSNPRIDGPVTYGDHTGLRNLRIAHIDVSNNRPDIGAADCTARLVSIEQSGSANQSSPDQSRLKAMPSTRLLSIHLAQVDRVLRSFRYRPQLISRNLST